MRILHVGTGYSPVAVDGRRSVDRSIFHMTRNQQGLGHKVEVLDRDTWLSGENALSNLVKVLTFCLLSAPELAKGIRKGEWDVVHAHSQFPAALVLVLRGVLGRKVPVFYTLHNPHLVGDGGLRDRLLHTLIEEWVLRRVDRVVAQTRSVGDRVAAKYQLDKTKVVQVFAGVGTPPQTRQGRWQKHKVRRTPMVLCPAVITPRKNQKVIVEALALMQGETQRCRVTFLGRIEDERYYQSLRRLAAGLGCANRMSWHDEVPIGDMGKWYSRATVVVFPSQHETQGLVPAEALAAGVPVVVSDIPPMRDLVDAGAPVWLCDPLSAIQWARQITRLLQNEVERYRSTVNGRRFVKEVLDWGKLAEKMVEEYQRLRERC